MSERAQSTRAYTLTEIDSIREAVLERFLEEAGTSYERYRDRVTDATFSKCEQLLQTALIANVEPKDFIKDSAAKVIEIKLQREARRIEEEEQEKRTRERTREAFLAAGTCPRCNHNVLTHLEKGPCSGTAPWPNPCNCPLARHEASALYCHNLMEKKA